MICMVRGLGSAGNGAGGQQAETGYRRGALYNRRGHAHISELV